MTMAMVGVGGIAATELLEPWPLKITFDAASSASSSAGRGR
jgi:hypothetical protein